MSRVFAILVLFQVLLVAGCGGGGSSSVNSSGALPQTTVATAATPSAATGSSQSTLEGTADLTGLQSDATPGGTLPSPGPFQGTPPTGATFTAIGTLPGDTSSQVYAISGDGTTLTGASIGTSRRVPFKWTAAGGMVALPVTQSKPNGEGHACSAGGDVIGGMGIFFDLFAGQLWTSSGVSTLPGAVDGTYKPAVVSGLSRDGRIATGTAGSGVIGYQAYLWTTGDANPTGLGYLGGSPKVRGSEAHGMSGDASVVTGVSTASDTTLAGYRWTAAGMTALPPIAGFSGTNGWAVSRDGRTIVGWATPSNAIRGQTFPRQATSWNATGALDLGDLGGFSLSSQAYGVSADGSIIVGVAASGQAFFDQTAFIWDATNGMRRLQSVLGSAVPSGWTVLVASAVSDNGKTVGGYAVDPNGNVVGFSATLP